MEYWDKLSEPKIKFLNDLGIFSEKDLPESFFEEIKELKVSESEKYCLDCNDKCYREIGGKFLIKDLVGTEHSRYAGKTWFDAFIDLDRGDKLIELYYENNGKKFYYDENVSKGLKSLKSDVGIANVNGNLFISSKHGGGNNRLIIAKIIYLALLDKCTNEDEINFLNENSWYRGRIYYCPQKEIADNIFFIEFPTGGFDTSGYEVSIHSNSSKNNLLYYIHTDSIENPVVIEGCELMTNDDLNLFRESNTRSINKKM